MTPNKPVTLLLVEDDEVDALAVIRGLRQHSISNPVIRAHDGVEALKLLRSKEVERPYMVLLDLQMPRMNGFEFLETLRSDPDLEDSVVFVLSTSRARGDIAATYQHQAAGYFVKDEVERSCLEVVKILDGYSKNVHLPNGGRPDAPESGRPG